MAKCLSKKHKWYLSNEWGTRTPWQEDGKNLPYFCKTYLTADELPDVLLVTTYIGPFAKVTLKTRKNKETCSSKPSKPKGNEFTSAPDLSKAFNGGYTAEELCKAFHGGYTAEELYNASTKPWYDRT